MRFEDAVRKYDAAAAGYDRFMDIVFDRILDVERQRKRVVELIGNVAGGTVLDVGCGTGRNFALLRQAVGEHGRVIGLDCSKGMLERARRRIEQGGWRNVELVLGDAVTLAEIDEPVDAVVSVWCYGTVYDIGAAIHRAVDVLYPGGRIGIVTFSRACPERGPLRFTYPLYLLALRCAGVDPSRDFDNQGLEAKWKLGREILRARLGELHEESYLRGAGLILAGRKPLTVAQRASAPGDQRAGAILSSSPSGSSVTT